MGFFSGRAVERLAQSPLLSVVVTDSLPVPPEKHNTKRTVLSVASLLAAAIKAIHHDDSVSALFR